MPAAADDDDRGTTTTLLLRLCLKLTARDAAGDHATRVAAFTRTLAFIFTSGDTAVTATLGHTHALIPTAVAPAAALLTPTCLFVAHVSSSFTCFTCFTGSTLLLVFEHVCTLETRRV